MKNSVEKKKNEIKVLHQELTLHMEEIQTALEKGMEDVYQALESIKNVDIINIKEIRFLKFCTLFICFLNNSGNSL